MSSLAALSRRRFLVNASTSAAAATLASPALVRAQSASQSAAGRQIPGEDGKVQLPQIHGASEQDEKASGPFLAPDKRVGYAIVGVGRLSINQILPAFGSSKYCRPAALVSGDAAKARK